MKRFTQPARRAIQAALRRFDYEVVPVEEPRFLRLRGGAPNDGPARHDRLQELRTTYADFDCPASVPSYWTEDRIQRDIDLAKFRDHTMYVWQYLERPRVTELKYFTYLRYVESLDEHDRLRTIQEGGEFGAPMFEFPERPPVSRDSLDSINEIAFLHRELGILDRQQVRVLDIGAGYGRLAHRMIEVVDGLTDYLCVDAVPESTFLCERYLAHHRDLPPARVAPLPDAASTILSSTFDLAVNIHSFSEMPFAAASYWIELVARAGIRDLLIIPNAPTAIRSREHDDRRIDLAPVLADHGYRLTAREPIIKDPAARALIGVDDHFHLFRREPS